MSSEIVFSGVLGAIIGATIIYIATYKQIKTENKRFLIQEMQRIKVNDTIELYKIVVDCVDVINLYGNRRLSDFDEIKNKVQSNTDKYENLKQKCEIWYDVKTIKLLNEIMATLRTLLHKLFLSTTQLKQSDSSNVFEVNEWKKLIKLKDEMKNIIHNFPEFKIYFEFIKNRK